jgi:ribosome-associated protein
MIQITSQLAIPKNELHFSASRSSGPGGQHVNKVSTRVTLRFDVTNSPTLSAEQKRRILARLPTRINKDGVLWVVSQRSRSQAANKDLAIERFVELLQQALKQTPKRKRTGISAAAQQRRLDEKKQRGRLKQERSRQASLDD